MFHYVLNINFWIRFNRKKHLTILDQKIYSCQQILYSSITLELKTESRVKRLRTLFNNNMTTNLKGLFRVHVCTRLFFWAPSNHVLCFNHHFSWAVESIYLQKEVENVNWHSSNTEVVWIRFLSLRPSYLRAMHCIGAI